MSISTISVLDVKGQVLISRDYRGDGRSNLIEDFINLVMKNEEEDCETPVIKHEECSFCYLKRSNVYIVAMSQRNVNAALTFAFLYKLVGVMKEYFGELQEESIMDNFVVIYELLDELMDFGYPQTTDSGVLKAYITQKGHRLVETRLPMAVTNAVSWRQEGLHHRSNDVFLDVVEAVNVLVGAGGKVLVSEVQGSIRLKVRLSGMPELRLCLNDRVLFEPAGQACSRNVSVEGVKFHQCVNLTRFERDRVISFIPPDGEFVLMSYRLSVNVSPLFWVETTVERHRYSRVEYFVKARAQFKRRSAATNVQIILPVSKDASGPKFRTSVGSARYAPDQDAVVWSIKKFPGGCEHWMVAHVDLTCVEGDAEDRGPVVVKFEIPYFTTSGLQVRYLKIMEKSGYRALPWVRYITQNGDYQIRLAQ